MDGEHVFTNHAYPVFHNFFQIEVGEEVIDTTTY